jgi:hypothetical protein
VLDGAARNAARISRNATSTVRLMSWQFIAVMFGVGYVLWFNLHGTGRDVARCNWNVSQEAFIQGSVIVLTGCMSAWMGVMLVRGGQTYASQENAKLNALRIVSGWNTDAIAIRAGHVHIVVSLIAVILSMAICFSMTSAEVLSSPAIQAFIARIARAVPRIYTVASITERPPIAQFAFAVEWLFMPVHFVLFTLENPVWGKTTEAKVSSIIAGRRAAGKASRYVIVTLFAALFCLSLVISDLQIMHLSSFASGEAFLESTPPLLALHRHSMLGVVFLAWLLPMIDACVWLGFLLTARALLIFFEAKKISAQINSTDNCGIETSEIHDSGGHSASRLTSDYLKHHTTK